MSRVHERLLRREIQGHAEGSPVQAVYQRARDGTWRVLVMVQDEDGHWLCELVLSPWKTTRTKAERWLNYRTRAA